ncbi:MULTISPECIES: Flp pilus assembly protein CpaB [Paraburkholderia]|jgi:pilus assembly protein CpaB|uniref:Flp pilus assembly protein CpaB n=1 Tax=Paraburkholderia hospita TaxID=169430 RepID=A0AAJ4VUT5_9BURK|nr:Flp pilus assembly protein CpaB [Paraburkholderia hospita]EUC18994.1 Flp pilus assembly protein CpaB [Burkholderia sp. BT03]SOE90927.1 Flp pilus assembly protein CpaB [Burkholderia sp. YR290]AUT71510.1 Flp pilus assembly protein CpaB [Paraburkholderia hospita]EIM99488.1 Flp pilus assembly protein CpaB [Paraburkholderia hospita]OUL67772.1 Flp pilus assembly protein CpaB [Paraburkholderia hospita]
MKNARALVMLVVATAAGLAAVVFASRWMIQQSSTTTTKVVIASADMSLGQRVSPDMLKVSDWPAGSVPTGTFNDVKKLEGRVLKTSLARGEPVLEAKLSPVGTVGGLSAVINEGKRAITVRVNDVIGVAGFALPGNYVDILVNTEKDNKDGGVTGRDQNISKIVLEKILVLAVAQEVGRDETKPKVVDAVTLEVTPEQAEKIDLARSIGSLSLVLRNQIDPQDTTTAGATKASLLKIPVAVPPAPAAPAPKPVVRKIVARAPANCVSVIDGSQARQECF